MLTIHQELVRYLKDEEVDIGHLFPADKDQQ